jgi:hypothetical protein
MATPDGRLTPSQLRAYDTVEDLCRRAAIELQKCIIAGMPCEQDQERLQHLLQACDGIKAYNQTLQQANG